MTDSAYERESLISDPIHGYIPYQIARGGEVAEQTLIDNPWLQRLRRIHQLQSVWWVYPSAEHNRFQHVLGAMHLAGRAARHLYPSLVDACAPDRVPSANYVESLARVAALVHDVGHGPFGHLFDDQVLIPRFGLTHEDVGQHIIVRELGDAIRGIRGGARASFAPGESLEPEAVAYLIKRPSAAGGDDVPTWLRLLRALFSGIYTVDNMDFVLRDSFMSGHGPRAFDLDRLLHYSFFTKAGLALHEKGLPTLESFIEIRGKLFQSIYYHRTVRAIDQSLHELFRPTSEVLLPASPLEDLGRYRWLTDWSLLSEVERWPGDAGPGRRELGLRWQAILARRVEWKMQCERLVTFGARESEEASIFSEATMVERKVRATLPPSLANLEFRADIPHYYHFAARPGAARQNVVYEPGTGQLVPLHEHPAMARRPRSVYLCRLFARDYTHKAELATALDRLLQSRGDDRTNM
jgi:hypothetical protein